MNRFNSEPERCAWQKARALELQRKRRRRTRRIDYYPTDEAVRIIDVLSRKGVRFAGDGPFRAIRRDHGSVISYIIETWNYNRLR